MKLILISNSGMLENESSIVTQLFEAGLECFHLRKPKQSTREIKKYIQEIPEHFHSRIVLHTHHKLARKFNLKGIHLTKTHKRRKFKTWLTVRLIQLRHPQIAITTSMNSIGQLLDPGEFPYSYVFLSPIFDSLNGKFQGGFTEHSLRSALSKTKYKVIARGGIEIDTIEKANNLGFDGLGFYSAFWNKKDYVQEFNKIVEKFEELKIPIE